MVDGPEHMYKLEISYGLGKCWPSTSITLRFGDTFETGAYPDT